jgi:hypothetical protein
MFMAEKSKRLGGSAARRLDRQRLPEVRYFSTSAAVYRVRPQRNFAMPGRSSPLVSSGGAASLETIVVTNRDAALRAGAQQGRES